jgi:SAM-dependent methyltransferase
MQEISQREYWSGKVGGEWAINAARIDAMFAPLTGALLDFAAFKSGERVLDIGCGAGATSIEIARRVGATGAVVGADLSPQMLHVARERARAEDLAIEFVEADVAAAALPGTFDAACSRFGVMFFDAPEAAFARIRDRLRQNGRIAFMCWRPIVENVWATLPLEAISPLLKAPLARLDPDAPGPYSLADEAKVGRVLKAAGWRDVSLSRWDGDLNIGGGGGLSDTADFILKIGPCARAVAEHELDRTAAKQLLIEAFARFADDTGVALPAACWLVSATA